MQHKPFNQKIVKMKLIILSVAIVAVTCAPPPSADLSKEKKVIPILKFENEGVNADGSYSWNYQTGNDISVQEQGVFKSGEKPDEGELEVRGSYEYTDPDGRRIVVTYIANKDGFQPQSDIIPTPPPVPSAIQKLLENVEKNPSEKNKLKK